MSVSCTPNIKLSTKNLCCFYTATATEKDATILCLHAHVHRIRHLIKGINNIFGKYHRIPQLRPPPFVHASIGRVYFRGGGKGVLLPPLGIDLLPLGNWLSLYLLWGAPLRIWICPLLKFATMRLPPLERNPEINPDWAKQERLMCGIVILTCDNHY